LRFTFYKQLNAMDCGPTCLRMIAKFHGKHYTLETLRQKAGFNRAGVSLLGLSDTAEHLGFRSRGVKITINQLANETSLPCILHWNKNHFVVLLSIKGNTVRIANPASSGIYKYTIEEFSKHWISGTDIGSNEKLGIALLLAPGKEFYEKKEEKAGSLNWGSVLTYLQPHKKRLLRIFGTLVFSTILQMIFPVLTQGIIDKGINGRDLPFILVILIAQLILLLTTAFVDFMRSRILLRMSNSINMIVLSDFWIKLTRLPLSYFATHSTGDTLQRIGDNRSIQSFITGSAINTIYSFVNFIVYTVALVWYSPLLFAVFVVGSVFYFSWVQVFQRFRRKINQEEFELGSELSNVTLQMVQGTNDLRLNNAEKKMRWKWENMQALMFKLGYRGMNYSQIQSTGALIINQTKNIFSTYLVAKMVISGELTFGEMFAIQYIIAQINGPVSQMVGFMQSYQGAKMSMERLNEIYNLEDEEPAEKNMIKELPENKSIRFSKLSFAYPGTSDTQVLKDIDLTIPEGKITAIVGSSGSGKTTLLKLLLKYYDVQKGDIRIGDTNFRFISPSSWRNTCGAVMQDGYIFNDSIAANIAVGEDIIDFSKLKNAAITANILDFINTLPNGFHTEIGDRGLGISSGQKQRLLIARAVYKDPDYLFFDEATNSLDANNERAIVENLNVFFKGKTVVIVAHRLSTVKHADNIVVLVDGYITEEGTHEVLTQTKGNYYHLVKNQLELGS